jgi:hypothetical protein
LKEKQRFWAILADLQVFEGGVGYIINYSYQGSDKKE